MAEKLIPLRDFVLVKPLEEPDKTLSGLLYVPKTSKARELRGEVLAVGPGHHTESGQLIPVPVNVGDVILAMEYRLEVSNGFQTVGQGERPPVLIPSGDIIARIERVDGPTQ